MSVDRDEPRTIASFRVDADPIGLGDALAAALRGRGLRVTPPVTIERATEFSVELGGRLVSVLVGAPDSVGDERFVSVGMLTFASGRLIGQRDAAGRADVAGLLDEVLTDDLGIGAIRWWTASEWSERAEG